MRKRLVGGWPLLAASVVALGCGAGDGGGEPVDAATEPVGSVDAATAALDAALDASAVDAGLSATDAASFADAAPVPPLSLPTGADTTPLTNEALLYEGAPRPYLRVDLQRQGGAVTLSVSRLETKPLVQRLGGDVLVVARAADGKALAVQRTSFHGRLVFEGRSTTASMDAVTVFLPFTPEVERIEVIASDGALLGAHSLDAVPATSAFTTRSAFEREFRHIRLVDRTTPLPLPTEPGFNPQLAEFTDELIDAIAQALRRAPPAALASVHSIAAADKLVFTQDCPGSAVGATAHGMVMIDAGYATRERGPTSNADEFGTSADLLTWAVVHESIHAFVNAIDDEPGAPYWNGDEEIASLQAQVRSNYPLAGDLTQYWGDIQQTAATLGKATTYPESCEATVAPPYYENGFATRYAAVHLQEDIAELATALQLAQDVTLRRRFTQPCGFFKSRPGNRVDAESALLYTKALYLKYIGLVSDTPLAACLYGLKVLPGEPGLELENQGGLIRLKDGVGATDNNNFDGAGPYLYFRAASAPYSAAIFLRNPIGRPLGFHRLDNITNENVNAPGLAGFFLGHDTNLILARTSRVGFVVVTEVTRDRISGLIPLMVLQNAVGNPTDFMASGRFLWTR